MPITKPDRMRGRRRWHTARSAQAAIALVDAVVVTVVMGFIALSPTHWWLWVCVGMMSACLMLTGQYRNRLTLSVTTQALPLVACIGVPLLVLASARASTPAKLLEGGGIAVLAILVLRAAAYSTIRTLRSRGLLTERTLVVGAGNVGQELVSMLEAHPEYGLSPVGFVDDVDASGLTLPLFGGVDLLRMVLAEERIEHIVIAFGVTREESMIDVFRTSQGASADVHLVPRFFELGATASGRDVDMVWGFPLVKLRRQALRTKAWTAKRALDVSLAGLGLLVSFPLYCLVATAVKLSSPGPVYFRQKRVSQRGTIMSVLKFRSMRVHDGSDREWQADGAQVTSVGKVLRKTGLDELPQLWNVLRGDMSLVGPRPERPFFVEQFKSEVVRYDDRHRVPPGLTGLAQVHGLRSDTPISDRVRFDNHYIENWSFMGDVRIILQTIFSNIRWATRPPLKQSGTRTGTGSDVRDSGGSPKPTDPKQELDRRTDTAHRLASFRRFEPTPPGR